jgi:hypothetical protein
LDFPGAYDRRWFRSTILHDAWQIQKYRKRYQESRYRFRRYRTSKRDIQRIGTDVKTLAEKKDENTTDIDYIKALFAEKGADIGTDLESIQLDVLKELLVKSEV